MMYRAASALLFAALLILGGPQFAHASNTGLSIQPIKVYHQIAPGESASGEILLTNASDSDIQVDVTLQDFIPEAGTDSINFVSRAPGLTTVKDWVTIGGNQSFVFKKGESRAIPYTISAPANAEPGSHFGVAFFKATDLAQAQAGLSIGTQVGMLVLVTVPGDYKEEGNITSFSGPGFVQGSPVPFEMTFENTGTIHFIPQGTITIKNMFGKVVGTAPIEGQVVLPTGVRKIKSVWETSDILMGWYTASASVIGAHKEELTTKEVTFWAFPIWYVLAFLVTLIALFFLFMFLKSRVRLSVSLK